MLLSLSLGRQMYQARAQILLFSPKRISASCLASHVNGLSVVAEEFVAMFGLFFLLWLARARLQFVDISFGIIFAPFST
jgi:hypothetical protein